LIQALQNYPEFKHLNKIHCQIRPQQYKPNRPLNKKRQPSQEGADLVKAAAVYIEHPQLRNALERLAESLKR
jgi:hypothetical protein